MEDKEECYQGIRGVKQLVSRMHYDLEMCGIIAEHYEGAMPKYLSQVIDLYEIFYANAKEVTEGKS